MRRIILAVMVVGSLFAGIGSATALPPGGTFVDDDGNIHEGYIEAIAAEGITEGCNAPINDRYCPDAPVTRGQMAAFLVRALDLSGDGDRDWFDDDDGSVFEPAINIFAESGITKGCNPPANSRFCPDQVVTRGEMAVFLARAFDFDGSSGDKYSDDDGQWFEGAVEAIAAAGVTKGCNPPLNNRFCPYNSVRRDEMATFLGRAIGLSPQYAPPRIDTGDVDVEVYPGDNLEDLVHEYPDGTVFLVHGVHYGQVVRPKDGQAFIGAEGAVMDGDGGGRAAFGGHGANVTVRGFEIRNYDNPVQWGAIHGEGPGWVVENNEVHHNASVGIFAENDSPVIRGNFVHHNYQMGIGAHDTTGGLFENNEVSYNNFEVDYDWGWEAGGSKFSMTDGLIVRGNYVHNNHGPGLWSDIGNYNILYEDNVVVDNYAAGIMHEISYDAVIRNNTVRGNGFGDPQWVWGAGIVISSSLNVEISGNLVEGNFNGITAAQQDRSGSDGDHGEYIVHDIYVHDNTVINSGISGIASDTGDSSIWSAGNRFRNNNYIGDVSWEWDDSRHSWSEWQDYGHDTGGSYTP